MSFEDQLRLQKRIEFNLRSGMDNRRVSPMWGDPIEADPLPPLYTEWSPQSDWDADAGLCIIAGRMLWEEGWRLWADHQEYVTFCHWFDAERAAGREPKWTPPKATSYGKVTGALLKSMLDQKT